ncbi:hypothetical protein BDZ94DRAFT_1367285 [Collybia nuda]|uniref:SET domain-containing protein n=1 Tax=Collybia nuda TaxID=64659 RepID=A0A9P5XR47_9AGAR|nr:hypothetical protein BDZ94DRAFT_1367285 [Collybia nuda]
MIVDAIFGPHGEKKREDRVHKVQSLSTKTKLATPVSRAALLLGFEKIKDKLDIGDAEDLMRHTDEFAKSLAKSDPLIKLYGEIGKEIASWCLTAYSLIINKKASVKLVVSKMGTDKIKGFGIVASVKFKKGEIIYELAGALAADDDAERTKLSLIKTNPGDPETNGELCVLFGPLRLINHRCQTPNVEYVEPVPGLASTIHVVKDIKVEEELFADYGAGYFNPCPCTTCNPLPGTSSSVSNEDNSNPNEVETDGEAQQLAKRAKKYAQREKK